MNVFLYLIILYPFYFKPSAFTRLTGSSDLKFFSSTSIYPSLIPFLKNEIFFYVDYRKPYGINEWNEVNFSIAFKKSFALSLNLFQKKIIDYSETEISSSFSKKIFKTFSLSFSFDYLMLNSVFKRENEFDSDVGFSVILRNLLISFNLKHIFNSFDANNYYLSLNYLLFEKFSLYASLEKEYRKAGLYLYLKPIIIFLSVSDNFLNTGFGLSFGDKVLLFSFEDNSYLGLSTGVSFELKK